MKKSFIVVLFWAFLIVLSALNTFRVAPHNFSGYTAEPGHTVTFILTGSPAGSVWGSNDNPPYYTDDSGLAAAAVHSGVISEGEKALVTFQIVAGGSRYLASESFGIRSNSYGTWRRGFRVVEIRNLEFPSRQASNVRFSATDGENGTISWLRGDGDAVVVFMKQTAVGAAYPIQNASYSANRSYGRGSQIEDTGWFCVYKGTETSVTVTGLNSSLPYSVSVMEYNYTVDGYETYNTSPNAAVSSADQPTRPAGRAQAFTFTGEYQYLTVPAGVSQAKIKVWGAGGAGRLGAYNNASGGSGGYAEAYLILEPGQRLVIVVGSGGEKGTDVGGQGGWPGGGFGTRGDASGGGGGGLTGVFLGSVSQENALIIAGAGGGGGGYEGGAGGGTGGNPGNQNFGGTGTLGGDGTALQGGNGSGQRLEGRSDGSGGGAGYFGGEGGFDDARGGGGGSGYIRPIGSMSPSLIMGNNGANTDVLPPRTEDPQYRPGTGLGRKGEYNGGNGLIIIEW